MGQSWGHGCFLPALPWLQSGRPHFPAAELMEAAKNMRQLMRLLWALHLAFQQVSPEPCLQCVAACGFRVHAGEGWSSPFVCCRQHALWCLLSLVLAVAMSAKQV